MELLVNPLFLLNLAVLAGFFIGKIEIARFRLGISGILFAGMILSFLVFSLVAAPYSADYVAGIPVPEFAQRILGRGLVDKAYFDFFLLLFVASVGLLAARDVAQVFRGNGLKFAILAGVITLAGATTVTLLFLMFPGLERLAIAGVYTGALTSSPGLGVALETVGSLFADPVSPAARAAQASVGMGYAAAYPFSVITVILGMRLLPRLFRIDMPEEVRRLGQELDQAGGTDQGQEQGFDMAAFALVCIIGFLIGRVSIGRISLETTGGVLVTALVLGAAGRIGPLRFRMSTETLNVVKQIALAYFLAYVGLNFGHQAIAALTGPSALLALVGMATTASSLLAGFLFGRCVLKMNWILLAGGVCGGMTSTPGLGAAIDTTGRNEAAGGYGSTYPLGLLFKVMLVLLMYRLPF